MKDRAPAFRAASMIAASIFQDWHARHPQWPLIEDAQVGTHARMIEVPDIEIAGHHVAKIWFTERPDANFRQYMSAMMDAPVEGSLGGNALNGLKVTIDYPNARAWVE